MNRTLAIPLFFLPLILPAPSYGQVWEIDAGWVRIDHDPPPWLTLGTEQIPDGIGVRLRKSIWRDDLLLGLEVTYGSDEVRVEQCGLPDPKQCGKLVRYSGGVSLLTLGWLGRIGITPELFVAVRPETGIGWVRGKRAREPDVETIKDSRLVFKMGISAGATVRLGAGSRYSLLVTGGIGQLRPVFGETCADCSGFFTETLPNYAISVGLRAEGWQ